MLLLPCQTFKSVLTRLSACPPLFAAGNFEFGVVRVMRALEPLHTHLDAPRWHAVMLCMLAMLDQVAKNMLILKDALVADLLSFLQDVEAAGRGLPALLQGSAGSSSSSNSNGEKLPELQQRGQTICGQARSLRAVLLKMSD